MDEINHNDLTEEMVLDAFKEEVRFIGTFAPFPKDQASILQLYNLKYRLITLFFPEFEGVNEHGNTLDDIHDAFLVLRENIRSKRLLKENLARCSLRTSGKLIVFLRPDRELNYLYNVHLLQYCSFLGERKLKKTMTLIRSKEVNIESHNGAVTLR